MQTEERQEAPTPLVLPWAYVPRRRFWLAVASVAVAVAILVGVQTYSTVVIHHQRTQITHLQREIARLEHLLHVGSA